jgi:hypothetical protein
VEDEDADERQRDQRDLVADERDRLAGPVAPEVTLPERRRTGA